jgi:hypothetical protein
MRTRAFWACSLLLFSSCAGPRSNIRSPFGTLTTENLEMGGMGIGGVIVTSDLSGAIHDPARLAESMRDAIIQTRQDFKIVSSEYIARTMGAPSYQALLRTYRQHSDIPDEVLRTIGPDFVQRFRFLVFARIDSDSISTHEQPATQTATGAGAVDFITRRHVGATFEIYDLQRHTRTATLHLTANADSRISRRDREYTPGTLSPRFPEPVDVEEACALLFENFSRELPGPAKDPAPDERY